MKLSSKGFCHPRPRACSWAGWIWLWRCCQSYTRLSQQRRPNRPAGIVSMEIQMWTYLIEGPTSGLFFMFKSMTWKKRCGVVFGLEEIWESVDILKNLLRGKLQTSRVFQSAKSEEIGQIWEMVSDLRGCAYNIKRYAEGNPSSEGQGRKTPCYLFMHIL
jgi:hypothetical protein